MGRKEKGMRGGESEDRKGRGSGEVPLNTIKPGKCNSPDLSKILSIILSTRLAVSGFKADTDR